MDERDTSYPLLRTALRLSDKATPGHWRIGNIDTDKHNLKKWAYINDKEYIGHGIFTEAEQVALMPNQRGENCENSEFIMAAVNAIRSELASLLNERDSLLLKVGSNTHSPS
ncbi:MAG: hypothetical protein SFW63_01480 [Alphaproteobacteria bacterium]|nr:hypothetical protein [Alphaproteobacteria bacterium]